MSSELDFFHLNELVLNIGAVNSPSELQGMLCGKLCGVAGISEDQWAEVALDFMDLQHVRLTDEQTSQLHTLYKMTVRLLRDVNFTFEPMLPGDEAPIARRVEELGYWCQGFLHGIGTSGLSGDSQLGADAADALRDLAQISQVSLDDGDDIEENEVYWQELVEYVKVAVLTLYTELSHSSENEQNKRIH